MTMLEWKKIFTKYSIKHFMRKTVYKNGHNKLKKARLQSNVLTAASIFPLLSNIIHREARLTTVAQMTSETNDLLVLPFFHTSMFTQQKISIIE